MKKIEVVSAAGTDIFHVPENFDPKIAFFDMDSTIVAAETLDEMAEMAGFGAEVKAITHQAMVEGADFDSSLRRRLVMLKGVRADDLLGPVYDSMALNPGAEELIAGLKVRGVKCVLVSGGFTFFTEKVAARLGMDAHHGNVLEIDAQGLLTGAVVNNADIVNGARKAQYVREYCEAWGAEPAQCLAAGDGSNDILMMNLAGLGIGYRPAPGGKVEAEIDNIVRYGDLSTILLILRNT
jgi:phosphoserine phosphatase